MSNQTSLSDAKQELLEKILRGEIAHPTGEDAIEAQAGHGPAPLTPSQRQIWLHSQMAPAVPVYNETITLCRRGPLDREALEVSLREMVRRHEILRTVFKPIDGQVVQVVRDLSDAQTQIPYTDLSALPEQEREPAAIRIATRDARIPFDLNVGPLFRTNLVKLDDDHYLLHLVFHHLIFDGMTAYRVILPELSTLYGAFSRGERSSLADPQLQYADYSRWQLRRFEDGFMAQQVEYWRRALAGAEQSGLQLPADRPRPAVPSFRGFTETFALPKELVGSVQRVAHQEGVTVYMFLLACFYTLLYRHTGQEDLMVGGITDGRRRAEFETLMGCFTNTVVLRSRPRGEMTFRQFLGQVKDMALSAMANGDVPFDLLVRELHPKRDVSRNPFYQAMFSISPPPREVAGSGWALEQFGIDTGASKCDLYLALDESKDGMIARLQYSSDLFDQATILRMTGHWLELLASAVRDPSAKLCDLAIMPPVEKAELIDRCNGTHREIPNFTIHELVEHQAALTPEAIAVEAAGVRLTYRQLNERANRLARGLRDAGVMSETLVAICVDRTTDLSIVPLAVLKAGGAYVPLDSAFPKERLTYLIDHAQAQFLVTAKDVVNALPATGAQVLYCDDAEGDGTNLESVAKPDSLAYVRYTSGSTGRPKGVEISHGALVNLLLSMQREPGFTKSDALLAITTHSFDISELELFLPLICGGRLVIAARADAGDPRRLIKRLSESHCNVMQATPATWRAMLEAGWKGQSNLKALCGGEALPRGLAEQLLPRVGELWNLYGPTETTVWSAVERVTSGDGPVPIGRPIDNTQMYILDGQQRLVPVGVVGDLYIGGAGVARGYLRLEEEVQRFAPNPFRPGERFYRTGDLARWLPDGTIECRGRVDNQVKIRGFRIEPDEIETALGRHPHVSQCAVVVREDSSGDKQLVAYLVSGAESAPSTSDLRAYLKTELPEYMVPSSIILLDKLPLTPNGKIDRKALLAREELPTEIDTIAGSATPLDPVEQMLIQVWAKVLGVKRVGLQDDFFDLGGHSLAAVRLLVEIEKVTGKALPLATFFQASTVEALAKVLRNDGWVPDWSSLVPIQRVESSSPLFLVHGAEGNLLLYRQLVRHLGPQQAVYGLQSRGLGGTAKFHTTIPEMASQYVKEVRRVQPQGPYFLGGYCLGGTIAFEMAQQLTSAGQRVDLVAMMDTYNTSLLPHSKAVVQAPVRLLQNLWFHFANALSLSSEERAKFLREKLTIEIARVAIKLQAALHSLPGLRKERLRQAYPHLILKKLNDRAAEEYAPARYAGRVAVIRSKGAFVGMRSPSLGWDQCVGTGLEIHELPMYPKGMLVDPFCRALAKILRDCLKHT